MYDSETANLAELAKEEVGIKSSNETSFLGEICLIFFLSAPWMIYCR